MNKIQLQKVSEAIDVAWQMELQKLFDKTVKGKTSPFDVTDKDWEDASFKIEDFKKRILQNLRKD